MTVARGLLELGAITARGGRRPSAAPSAAPSVEASAPAAGDTTLALADSALGKIVVDGQGKTLYMFTPDEDQAAPTCVRHVRRELARPHRDRDARPLGDRADGRG